MTIYSTSATAIMDSQLDLLRLASTLLAIERGVHPVNHHRGLGTVVGYCAELRFCRPEEVDRRRCGRRIGAPCSVAPWPRFTPSRTSFAVTRSLALRRSARPDEAQSREPRRRLKFRPVVPIVSNPYDGYDAETTAGLNDQPRRDSCLLRGALCRRHPSLFEITSSQGT